jgi:drug/metabolite transporter (DMT)-like permease
VLALAGAVAFSGKAIIIKLAYRHGVDAVTLLMLRMLFSLPLFLALAWWAGRGQPPLTARDWRVVLGLGFLGYYLASFLDFAGLQYISAGLERVILYLNPTLVLLLGWLFYRRPIGGRQVAALVVSYLGVMVVFAQEISLQGRHVALGAGLVFGSALAYALYLIFSGEEVKRLGALRLTGLATSVACVLCIGQFLVLRPLEMAWTVSPEVIGLSLLNAALCTFAPVLMVMMAIERIGPAVTSQAGMIGPVSTLLLAAWVRVSVVLVALFFDQPASSLSELVGSLAQDPEGFVFFAVYFMVGSAFAWLVFATGVASLPMMLDRQVDVLSAMIWSFQAAITNSGAMLRWAATIAVLVGLGMLGRFLPLALIVPLIGHASWHVYRELSGGVVAVDGAVRQPAARPVQP